MAKKTSLEELMGDLKKRDFKPVYFFTGEETYYIDKLTEYIIDNALKEDEKAFNQTIIYGKDADAARVLNAVRRFPMMSAFQLVVLKEAQELKDFDNLVNYIEKPLKSTIFVINYKYKSLDKRKKIYKVIEQNTVLYESAKLYDDKVPEWISRYLSRNNYRSDSGAPLMLTEFLGNDLSRIANELDKLMMIVNDGSNMITSEIVERNIGISKDFNNFELQNAIARKDILKANRIINYFAENQKNTHITQTIVSVYFFFSKVLLYHSLKDRSRSNAASQLKVNPYFLKDYELAAGNYNLSKTVRVISYLREYDLKSKGFNNSSSSAGELLKELMFKILH